MSVRPELWHRVKAFVADALERRAQSLRDVSPTGPDVAAEPSFRSILAHSADPVEVWEDELSSTANEGHCGPGVRLGAYQLVREIGRGDLGVVFLATRAGRGSEKN